MGSLGKSADPRGRSVKVVFFFLLRAAHVPQSENVRRNQHKSVSDLFRIITSHALFLELEKGYCCACM